MIRLAQEEDFAIKENNEVLVRILGIHLTYGTEAPFVRYYTDGTGSLLTIMDGAALFHTDELNDEWSAFLAMNPDIISVHCTQSIGDRLIQSRVWKGRVGHTMEFTGKPPQSISESVCATPHLPAVYELLRDHFPGISPFNSWYPDVSHRLRHGNSHISVIQDDKKVISTAMTVAETDNAAVLGQVATHPDFRRRGMAETCVKSTVFQCKGKKLYILPVDDIALKLYKKLGFEIVGGWAELERIQ